MRRCGGDEQHNGDGDAVADDCSDPDAETLCNHYISSSSMPFAIYLTEEQTTDMFASP